MILATLPAWGPALTPALALATAAMIAFLIDAVVGDRRIHWPIAGVAILGTAIALGASLYQAFTGNWQPDGPLLAGQLVVDPASVLFTAVVTSATLLVLLGAVDYLGSHDHPAEFYSLVLLAATGMVTLASANTLLTAFIAFELTSLPSYVLVAYHKSDARGTEASLKYFLIGALSSALLVYGMSLLYATTGALGFDAIAAAIAESDNVALVGAGIVLILAGFGFKLAAVPFHFWAPDAYGAAPAPVGAFLSSASKAAGFVIVLRVFYEALPISALTGLNWVPIFGALAVLTMLLGNFAAVRQSEVKRMLAYSSIGHAGYVLIALAAFSSGAVNNTLVVAAGILHLFVYGFMNTGAFLFVAMGEYWGLGDRFEDYAGLYQEAPGACLAMTVLLFNLAGLPLGGGFWGKFVLFTGAIETGFWWLAAVGAIASAVSVYYYVRLVKAMWIDEPTDPITLEGRPTGLYAALFGATAVTVLLIVGYGIVADVAIEAAHGLLGQA